MVSVKESFASKAAVPRILKYHTLASRYLQKQFVHACVCSLMGCYICSYLIGERHDFSNLFPWTWTGLRAIGLFIAVFPVALMRKVNLHGQTIPVIWCIALIQAVIALQRRNKLRTISHRLFSIHTVRSLMAYLFGALLMTWIYINNCGRAKGFSVLISIKYVYKFVRSWRFLL